VPPSPPAEKATTKDQSGKPRANYWTRSAAQVVELNAQVDGRVGVTGVTDDTGRITADDIVALCQRERTCNVEQIARSGEKAKTKVQRAKYSGQS
jgi:hypothetical protein